MEGWCIIIAVAVGPYLYKQILKNLINICYSLFYDQKQKNVIVDYCLVVFGTL